MNRITGEVSRKTIEVEKPIIGILKNVRQVETPVETMVNMNTGKVVEPYDTKAVLHGTN
jgi:hypothetical protein